MAGYLGFMNPYMPMEMAMRQEQLMGQVPFGAYDPAVYMNPMMAPYMGTNNMTDYLRSMMSMQNPQLMLPQNMGGFLGSAIGRMFAGKQQAAPQAGGPQDPPPAQNPLVSQIYQLRSQYLKQGMPIGAAQAKAISVLAGQPQYQDPQSQMVFDQGMKDAQQQLGYQPGVDQKAEYQEANYMNRKTGAFQTLSAAQWNGLPDKEDWSKMDNTPQMAPGRFQTVKIGGQYVNFKTMPDGTQQYAGTSTEPEQFVRTAGSVLNVTPQDIASGNVPPGVIPFLSTAAAGDAMKTELGKQEAAVRQFDLQSQDVIRTLQGGAPGGWAGNIAEKADNFIGSVGQIADTLGDTKTFDQVTKSTNGLGILANLKLKGNQAVKLNQMLNSAAYLYWKSMNPTGRFSPTDLTKSRDELIGDNADPNAIVAAIQAARTTAIRNFQITNQEMDNRGYMYQPQWYGKTYYGPGSLYQAPPVQPSTGPTPSAGWGKATVVK